MDQNWDMGPSQENMLVFLKMKPKNGTYIMALATVGSLGQIGVKSAGLSVNGNQLIHKYYVSPGGIFPDNVIKRGTLGNINLKKVISAIATAKKGSAVHQLFGNAQGDVLRIEVTGKIWFFIPG